MNPEPVTLPQIKMHLRLEEDDASQDAYLGGMILAARRAIENNTGRTIATTWPTLAAEDRVVVAQAMLLLIGQWYAVREATGRDTNEMPLAVRWLLDPLRKYAV